MNVFNGAAERQNIPLRTLEQVKAAMVEASKRNAGDAMARLLLRHGRLTDEAILWLGDNYAVRG
jgi:hypothetical protein